MLEGRQKYGFMLMSRIPMRVSLNTSMQSVKRKLEYYPALVKISDGSSPRYMVCGEEGSGTQHIFEFSPEHIILETYSKISPLYTISDSLLKLLAVSAFLSSDYSFSIESLFPYIVVALSEGNKAHIAVPEQMLETKQPSADILLAKRINELRNEVAYLKDKNESMSALITELVAELLLFEASTGEISAEAFLSKYRIDTAFLNSAIGLVKEKGYVISFVSKGRFKVVRV